MIAAYSSNMCKTLLFKTTRTCWRWNTRPRELKLTLWRATDSNKVAEEQGMVDNRYVLIYELKWQFKPYTSFNCKPMELFY